MLKLHQILIMSHVVAVFILFYKPGWQGGVFQIMKKDHFLVFLAFWVLKEWLMLELHKVRRVAHAVSCPIVFFKSNVGREECSKL